MISAAEPIGTLEDLRDHLQYAIGIELTTIPAYLCALYSIKTGRNTAAYEVLQSVVMEEMLHMAQAANVLNAIGGVPATGPVGDGPSPIPTYPTSVPFIDRIPTIHLQPFSPAALDEFLAIELPDDDSSLAAASREQYASIGTFYDAIADGIRLLATPEAFDEARHARRGCQIPASAYYGGAGALIVVHDQATALAALDAIAREGEGAPLTSLTQTAAQNLADGARTPGRLPAGFRVDDLDRLPFGWRMYSHYARFREIREGRHYRPDQTIDETPAGDLLLVDWTAVHPMTPDPSAAAFADTAAYPAMTACNDTYRALVDLLYRSFNGHPHELDRAVPMMYQLKYQAGALLTTPSPLDPARTLGPAFEYFA